MRRPGIGSAPLRPDRAFGPGNLNRLMMAKGRERLHDDRVCAIREANRRRKMVVQVGLAKDAGRGAGVNRDRLTTGCHVPAGEVKKMNWLFENPASDSLAVVAPAAGALAIGKTRELDERGT